MNENVKQHYVPKFYLKNFTATRKDAGHLHVFDKATGTWKPDPSTPKAEAWEPHMNTIYVEGAPSDIFDSFLGDIEDEACKVVYRIVTEEALPKNKKDKEHLARFVASTAFRTPGHRSFVRQVVPMIFGSALSDLSAQDTRRRSWIGKLLGQLLVPAMEHLLSDESMIVMIPASTLYQAAVILKRNWHLIRAEKDGPHFVTSDNPVIGLLSAEVALPLSPWVALLASDQVGAGSILDNGKYVRAMNRMTFDNALTSVYAHQPNGRFLSEMEQLGKRGNFKSMIDHVKDALQNP
jgi:hypothetical protein